MSASTEDRETERCIVLSHHLVTLYRILTVLQDTIKTRSRLRETHHTMYHTMPGSAQQPLSKFERHSHLSYVSEEEQKQIEID